MRLQGKAIGAVFSISLVLFVLLASCRETPVLALYTPITNMVTTTQTDITTQINTITQTDIITQSVTPPPQTIILPVPTTVIKSVTSVQTATVTAPASTSYQTSTASPNTVIITYPPVTVYSPPVTIYSPPPTTSYSPPPPTTGIGRSIIVTYSGISATQIGTGSFPVKPTSGNIFMVVNLTIQNQGYASFSVMDWYFKLNLSNTEYNCENISVLQNRLSTADVLNGGSLTGQMAFEIPASSAYQNFELDYLGPSIGTINWIKQ